MVLDTVTASKHSYNGTLLCVTELRNIEDVLREIYHHLPIRYVQLRDWSMLNAFNLTGVVTIATSDRQTSPHHPSQSPHACAPLPPNEKPAWAQEADCLLRRNRPCLWVTSLGGIIPLAAFSASLQSRPAGRRMRFRRLSTGSINRCCYFTYFLPARGLWTIQTSRQPAHSSLQEFFQATQRGKGSSPDSTHTLPDC